MFTGWLKPFDTQRPLTPQERKAALTSADVWCAGPDEQLSLVKLNGTFAEFIDRAFRMRGSVVTLFALACSSIIVGAFVYVVSVVWGLNRQGLHSAGTLLTMVSIMTVVFALILTSLWRRGLGRELFAYVYYPVRFDRVRKQVHVFRHNGKGGVLSVPFDEVYWFIGRGERMDFLYDLRGAVLEGDRIVHMFAVGQYFEANGEERVRSLWSFICTYMQGGPDALAACGVAPRIDLSVRPSWRNCWRWKLLMLGEGAARLRYVLAPFYYTVLTIMTAWRWLIFKTCRMPHWPAELFDATNETSERSRWPEPMLIGGDEPAPNGHL
ncbi:hypothetical protein [[Pseudomonas] boreopolis]|uniref:hypothetical protein n=1 Tax=Xanthomonas boreopolis TaxID=86183 RepID=UPI003D4D67C5